MSCYAVESYNSDTNTYSRYDVGDKDTMTTLLNTLISDDVANNTTDNYYRVTEVSDEDLALWERQVKYLPDVPNKDKVFGEWIQINTAAKYLDVTFGRVFNLVTAGDIKVNTTVGRNKLVSASDIIDRKINKPKSGRPAGSPNKNHNK